jgi:predicted DsbA family dithiol-disulfide isomerase
MGRRKTGIEKERRKKKPKPRGYATSLGMQLARQEGVRLKEEEHLEQLVKDGLVPDGDINDYKFQIELAQKLGWSVGRLCNVLNRILKKRKSEAEKDAA